MTIGIIILAALTGVVEGQALRVVGEELQETERILANEGNKDEINKENFGRQLKKTPVAEWKQISGIVSGTFAENDDFLELQDFVYDTKAPALYIYLANKKLVDSLKPRDNGQTKTDALKAFTAKTSKVRVLLKRDPTNDEWTDNKDAVVRKPLKINLDKFEFLSRPKKSEPLYFVLWCDDHHVLFATAQISNAWIPGSSVSAGGSAQKPAAAFIVMSNNYKTICPGKQFAITNAQTCKDAALQLEVDYNIDNITVSNNKVPSGCIVEQGKGGKLHEVNWNGAKAKDVTLKYDAGYRVVCHNPATKIAFGR